ncbi:MAG: hypothetical protein EHM20_00215 [Alphaproteobacteria bacterium]|nr:MAG: hypothetical protein EHM20_00215 [Alphaproteobacteria bacterium]
MEEKIFNELPFTFIYNLENRILNDYPRNGPEIIKKIKYIANLYDVDYEYLLLEMNNVIYGESKDAMSLALELKQSKGEN